MGEDTSTDGDEIVGAPKPEGLDPELVRLPYARTRVRPILALAVVAICLILVLRLLDDLSFSREGEHPTSLDSIADLSGMENRFVEVLAPPDRPQALRLVPSRGTTGQVLMPALGTGGKLWILVPTTPWDEEPHLDERYQGRLLKMGEMRFFDELRDHLESADIVHRPVPRLVVQAALRDGTGLHDSAGDALQPVADSPVRVVEVSGTHVEVLAVSTDSYPDEAGWNLALRSIGLLPANEGPVTGTPTSWTYHVPSTAGVEVVAAKLAEAKLFGARASQIANTKVTTWSELQVVDDQLVLGTSGPGFSVQSVAVGIPYALSADAWLLDTTETPGSYWYILGLVIALLLFALLFLFGIYRNMRP